MVTGSSKSLNVTRVLTSCPCTVSSWVTCTARPSSSTHMSTGSRSTPAPRMSARPGVSLGSAVTSTTRA